MWLLEAQLLVEHRQLGTVGSNNMAIEAKMTYNVKLGDVNTVFNMERARRLHQNALEIIPKVIAPEDQGVHHFTALTAISPQNAVVHLTKSISKI